MYVKDYNYSQLRNPFNKKVLVSVYLFSLHCVKLFIMFTLYVYKQVLFCVFCQIDKMKQVGPYARI